MQTTTTNAKLRNFIDELNVILDYNKRINAAVNLKIRQTIKANEKLYWKIVARTEEINNNLTDQRRSAMRPFCKFNDKDFPEYELLNAGTPQQQIKFKEVGDVFIPVAILLDGVKWEDFEAAMLELNKTIEPMLGNGDKFNNEPATIEIPYKIYPYELKDVVLEKEPRNPNTGQIFKTDFEEFYSFMVGGNLKAVL